MLWGRLPNAHITEVIGSKREDLSWRQSVTGSSDNEELTLFNELVTNWFDAGGFDACDREEQRRRSKIITSIRRKLQVRSVGAPKKTSLCLFMMHRLLVQQRLAEAGETRKLMIRAVMASLMGWTESYARELERTYDPESPRWQKRLKWAKSRGYPLLTNQQIDDALMRVQQMRNGDN